MMPTRNARDVAPRVGLLDVEPAVLAEGQVVLRDLVALHQVGVGVVLAVELGERRDGAIEGEARQKGLIDGLGVDHGQGAGHTQADRAYVELGGA